MGQPGFFEVDERYSASSKQGDPLEVLNESIPWSTFGSELKENRGIPLAPVATISCVSQVSALSHS